jgi:hypothetical protein
MGDRYRRKAEEIRAAAEAMAYGPAREAMFRVADDYEVLAKQADSLQGHLGAAIRTPKKSG